MTPQDKVGETMGTYFDPVFVPFVCRTGLHMSDYGCNRVNQAVRREARRTLRCSSRLRILGYGVFEDLFCNEPGVSSPDSACSPSTLLSC